MKNLEKKWVSFKEKRNPKNKGYYLVKLESGYFDRCYYSGKFWFKTMNSIAWLDLEEL